MSDNPMHRCNAAQMTFGDLNQDVCGGILWEHDDPAMITAEVTQLLEKASPENTFVVHRFAKTIAAAIAQEHASGDVDIVSVVQRLSAVLEPAIVWLKRSGVNYRSLRPNQTRGDMKTK